MKGVAPISGRIWDQKYRFKDADGRARDRSLSDSWRRVARAMASVESDPNIWEDRFHEAMDDFRFLPAGRILAGAGTERSVTLFNCFVMGTIEDDMSGIFSALREAALTMQQGGGIGYDFSTLRPKGAPVRGVGADASGPLSFMDVWDAMCRTIMSAGSRRGAMMATLRCDHPDIEAFIDAKQDPARLRMFNLSVLVTDAFMEAVRAGDSWDLVFGGTVFRTLQARDLWDRIMRSTYLGAEPGVIFIDRINQRNNLAYCETISATNPCVTKDTWIQTSDGPKQVEDLLGLPFHAMVNGAAHATTAEGFHRTGTKPVVHLSTMEGYSLRLTPCHRLRKVTRRTRWSLETDWTPAGALAPGDEIVLHDHGADMEWIGAGLEHEGYLLGLLLGDGTVKADKTVLSVWPGAEAVNGAEPRPGVRGVMRVAEEAARRLGHRSDFSGWVRIRGRGEYRLSTAALRRLGEEYGFTRDCKGVTASVERTSSAFHRGFLRGLFDADGGVQGDRVKGVSVRLAQSSTQTLEAAQRMLLRLGIASTIYRNRRSEGYSQLPDGQGGRRDYAVRAQHELVISGANLARFQERVGFEDTEKALLLKSHTESYRRSMNRERFVARVARIDPAGEEDVFDVTVPGVNCFDANGIHAHNCGEQPLPPYGACLLGSINLARLVNQPFESGATLDIDALAKLVPVAVRMMDNVVDVSRFPLPEQAAEARAKRRIGLGVTGLADALIMCGARYGSAEAVRLTETWMRAVRDNAYRASVDLAREKGAFPLFERDRYLDGECIRELPEDIRAGIAEHGIRNALLTSIAPTGTISLLADNVSSGLEPVFAFSYERAVLEPDGSKRIEEVSDHAYRLYRSLKGEDAPLTDAFVDAQTLRPEDHVVMQAAVQKYVDSSISKTINCPEDIDFEAFKDVYLAAYDSGCKGCTTYRPNPVTGAVLTVKPEAPAAKEALTPALPNNAALGASDDGKVVQMAAPLDRPSELPGKTYKIKWPENDHAIYITLNDIIQDGRRRPFEIFINSKNMEHYAWTVALTRMISAVFRRGGDVSFVVEELKAVFDPRGGAWMDKRYVPSLLAAIGGVIEEHMIDIGFLRDPDTLELNFNAEKKVVGQKLGPNGGGLGQCPKCGTASLLRQEGCDLCTSCGFSKCG